VTPTRSKTLGLKECAQRLGVHYMTVYRYVRTGMLPATKIGFEWRIAADDLEAFAAGADSSEARRRPAP
jgi:excisionase family DNA binding protein